MDTVSSYSGFFSSQRRDILTVSLLPSEGDLSISDTNSAPISERKEVSRGASPFESDSSAGSCRDHNEKQADGERDLEGDTSSGGSSTDDNSESKLTSESETPSKLTNNGYTPGGHAPSQDSPVSVVNVESISSQGNKSSRKSTTKRLKVGSREVNIRSNDEYRYETVRGTTVKVGHTNYVLMYNMLTGIRIAVSRCQAKVPRPLLSMDFKSANKVAFDIMGNELMPSFQYDFKFKDYATWTFREIRRHFCVDPAEYLLSLTNKYVLSEKSSPGKSGSFFYYSADYRFIIKTIHRSEHRVLRKFIRSYFEHIFKYPNTLIARIFGLHRVKLPRNKKVHFVVMDNILPPEKDIHALYDLKGSLHGRSATAEEKERNSHYCVLKDMDWLERKFKLKLGPVKREILMRQLVADLSFLASHDIMDYSLLVGIHELNKGNSERIRGNILSIFEPESNIHNENLNFTVDTELGRKEKVRVFRSVLSKTDPVSMEDPSMIVPPLKSREDRKNFIFYKNDGGFFSTDANNCSGDEIYYLGIIDIFTKFGPLKIIENAWKSLRYKASEISAVNPQFYSERLLSFVSSSIVSTAN